MIITDIHKAVRIITGSGLSDQWPIGFPGFRERGQDNA